MKIIDKKQELETTVYTVKIDDKIWKDSQAKAKKDILANIEIPGFRKGHVPENKANISEGEVLSRAVNVAVDKELEAFWVEFDKKPDEKINQSSLSLDLDKFSASELVIKLNFENYPTVTIDGYDKIKLDYKKPEVTDKEIDYEINQLTKRDYMLSESKEPIKNGNMVKFDFKGFVNDKPFEGGEASNFDLEVGSGSFIPGFEEQMVGLKKGDKKSIEVSFPKDYHVADLAGKKARFDLDIKEISNITRPVLDEAYLAKLNMPNVKTIKDLRKFYHDYLFEMKNQYANQKPKEQIREFLTEHAKLSFIPKNFVERQLADLRKRTEEDAKRASKEFEKYIKEDLKFKDIKSYEADMKLQIEKNIKYSLAVNQLVKKLGIEVTPEDIENEIKKVAAMYGMPADKLMQDQGMKERMAVYLTEAKLFDKIIALNLKK